MDTFDAIHTRRSVRAFTDEPVTDEDLNAIIRAAAAAPSAGNAQMWAFVSVREEKRIKAVQALSPGIIGKPAAVIVMCLDQSRRASIAEGAVDIMPYFDIGAALQNISLAAHDLGLGSCAIGSFHPAGLAGLLNLPDSMQPVLLVTLGTPRKVPRMPRKLPLEDIFFQEHYRESDG